MIPIVFTSSKHKFCHLCGRPLALAYTRYSTGLVVCSQCERTAPRCTACQQPARSLTQVDQERLCNHCLNTLPRCTACNKPITGHYFRFGDSSKPYCATCAEQRPACHICGAPLGADGQQLSGGQYRCGECVQTMVLDDQTVQALFRMVIQQARAIFEQDVQHIPLLCIVEPAELAVVRRRHELLTPPIGAAKQHILGFFEQQGLERTIYIERALPRATLIGTLAHEYAHAWQADYAPHMQATLQREGFAEWLSWSVLVALGHTREAARATRRDDDYGKGLRHFIALEKQQGRQAVFREAARAT
ncbi:MAG TPA: hypothetical protein VH590_11195 [Ktedonobacterales bacterium]|jgi:hypothetical protein